MNQHEQKVAEILASGQQPTLEDLGQALAAVMKERNAFLQMTKDMGEWLSKLVVAHARRDAFTVKATLDDFMAKHVQVKEESNGRVH